MLRGRLHADFGRRKIQRPYQVEKNLADRHGHATRLLKSIDQIQKRTLSDNSQREREGLPQIDAGTGFLLQIPDQVDPDQLAHNLGLELVAESDDGFIFVATKDIELARLKEVVSKFDDSQFGGGAAAFVIDVFESPNDPHRLDRLLTPEVKALWPLNDNQEYIFDLAIQTAESTRSFAITRVQPRKDEPDEAYRVRRETARDEALANADEEWTLKAEERFHQLHDCIRFYGGTTLTGLAADAPVTLKSAICFPDSFQVRARVTGRGWRDIFYNSPHLFEVSLPEEVDQPLPPNGLAEDAETPDFEPPTKDAPRVCIIDSGIQEGHIWLESAIETAKSRCFIPGRDPADVADEVPSGGHGTPVAGAVLYPNEVPRDGVVGQIAWLQNARVLDKDYQLSDELPPARYIQQVVDHFADKTRLFNHSISARIPCSMKRMTTWAAKIDELSHTRDVLFLQAAGNILGTNNRPNNPGVLEHTQAGRAYPTYLVEGSSRIANPAQSLQALTVGSICAAAWHDGDKRSFAPLPNYPSAFSRTGLGVWGSIKPEVVEIGGDFATNDDNITPPTIETETSIELIRATGDGGPAIAREKVGTSFATPKVAHLAALLQSILPRSSPLLWRALIVQSARWPDWFQESGWTVDEALRLLGFGLPSRERAMENSAHRVTLITHDAIDIRNQQLHLFKVIIPEVLRNRADDILLRLDVTLSYSSEPRRNRSSRRGYIATWLDWRSSGLGEPVETFVARVASGEDKPDRNYKQLDWCLHYSSQFGEAEETHRGNGTIQKDWARVPAHELPEEFAIAIRAHKGWDHREDSGGARYCLVVTIEAEDQTVPVYASILEANVDIELPLEQQAALEVAVQSEISTERFENFRGV